VTSQAGDCFSPAVTRVLVSPSLASNGKSQSCRPAQPGFIKRIKGPDRQRSGPLFFADQKMECARQGRDVMNEKAPNSGCRFDAISG
jgi:hypothetical protein